jgi:hypothetical protein
MYKFKHNDSFIEYNNGFLINKLYDTNLFFIVIHNKTLKVAYTDDKHTVILTKSGSKYLYYEKNKFYNVCFEPYMIVYEKSKTRIDNYKHINKLFNNIISKFCAVDTITDNHSFEEMVLKCIKNNTITKNYVRDVILKYKNNNYAFKGKLGVLLSHTNLFKKIISEEQNKKWFLIMEDDVSIDLNINDNVIQLINEYIKLVSNFHPKCKYIKLFIHSDNTKEQFDKIYEIHYKLFKLSINQWSNVIYLIHYDGIKILLDNLFPVDTFFDKSISKLYNILNGVVIKNDIFKTSGSTNSKDKNSKLGSIIYNIS